MGRYDVLDLSRRVIFVSCLPVSAALDLYGPGHEQQMQCVAGTVLAAVWICIVTKYVGPLSLVPAARRPASLVRTSPPTHPLTTPYPSAQPYERKTTNSLAQAASYQIFFVYFLALLTESGVFNADNIAMGIVCLATNFVVIAASMVPFAIASYKYHAVEHTLNVVFSEQVSGWARLSTGWFVRQACR